MAVKRSRLHLKELESYLEDVDVFDTPKILLEQYTTTPHIAARVLHMIHTNFDDIHNQTVADLGCGCGVLGIGAKMLGACHVVGIDIDTDALDVCRRNVQDFELDLDLIQMDATEICQEIRENSFDTVIMNPPFGTKKNQGIDMKFIQAGLHLARTAVYSLHKTSTRAHIEKKAKDYKVHMEVLAELKFNLDNTYKCHKQKSVDIQVDLIRFSFK